MTVRLLKGRYEILETLGRGGQGRVVKALDHQHDRLVALKIRPLVKDGDRRELLAEAKVLFGLPSHPALPVAREDFFDGGSYVIAMDWVDGTDLATLLEVRGRPGLAPSSVLTYLADTADALTHLHSQQPPVVHGDVKPGNLVLASGGRVRLVDFGLSSMPTSSRRRAGTPGFSAPELSAGSSPSRATDVYSLAATAFALLTGSPPSGVLPDWAGFDATEAEQLEAALRLGLATDPAQRPATPGEFVERLRAGWGTSLPTGVVTFCVSDIEGSTALWDEKPAAMALALVRHDELIATEVEANGGRFLKSMGEGDSTVSVFSSARQAVEAAIAVTNVLAAEPWPEGLHLRARLGVHTGEAERRGTDYFGPTINLAARLRAQADGGQVFCSETTSELVVAQLPAGHVLVDLGLHHLRGIRQPERVFAISGPSIDAPFPATDCPYRGLLAFGAEDRDLFFGREHVVNAILERLRLGQLLALVGASGSGKSSLLGAGLLGTTTWPTAALVTPGQDCQLPTRTHQAGLLIVDQFEEVFTQCDDPMRRAAYIDDVLSWPGPVVIGVRADFYGQLASHARLARAVAGSQILLGAMTDEELRRAITEPARLAGLKLGPGLVDAVVHDIAGEPGSLPLLSHALRATWELRDGRTLTVDGYRETGGVESAIARTADRVLEQTPAGQTALLRSLFLRLTAIGDGVEETRRRVDIDDLVPEDASRVVVQSMLETLADARLVTLDQGNAQVAHEALIREWPTLRSWLDEDRDGLRLHRRLGDVAQLWHAGGRDPSDLYGGARLDAVGDWMASHRDECNATELAFFAASVTARQAEETERVERVAAQSRANRRLRRLLAASAAALLVALLAGSVAVAQRRTANRERDRARSAARQTALRALIDSSTAQRSTKRDLAALLAVAAYRAAPGPASEGALLDTFTGSPGFERPVPIPGRTSIVGALLPDGRTYAAVDDTIGVRLVDINTGAAKGRLPPLHTSHDGDALVDLSPDGRYLAVASDGPNEPNVLTVWDLAKRHRRFPDQEFAFSFGAVSFSPDGSLVAVSGGPDASVEVRNARNGSSASTIASLPRPAGAHLHTYTAAVHFLPDGTLAVGSQGGSVRVVDPRTGAERTRLKGPPETSEASLETSADGRTLVGTGYGGTEAWSLTSGQVLWKRAAPGGCNDVAIAARIGAVLCARPDSRVQAFDLLTGSVLGARFDYQLGIVSAITISDNGRLLIEVGGPALGVWHLDGSGPVTRRAVTGSDLDPQSFDDRGDLLVGQGDPNGGLPTKLQLIDPSSGQRIDQLNHVRWATTTPRRDRLFALFTDGTGGFYDLTTNQRVPGTAIRLPFTPTAAARAGGTLVAAGDGNLQGIDLTTGRLTEPRVHQAGPILDIAAAPTGGHLFTVEPEGLIPRAGSGRKLGPAVAMAGVTIGDRDLVLSTDDGHLRVLDPTTLRPAGRPLPSITGLTSDLALSGDGARLLIVGADRTLRVADMATRDLVGDPISMGQGTDPTVALRADGRRIAFADDAGIIVWDLDADHLMRAACRVAGRNLTRTEWNTNVSGLGPYRRLCPDQPAAAS